MVDAEFSGEGSDWSQIAHGLHPGPESFALLPVYDMLPMRLARPGQPLESLELAPPLRTRHNKAIWERTGLVARRYWQQLRDEDTLSDAFRTFADRHARRWGS